VGLTRKRDLRDGQPVWTRYPLPRITGTRLKRSTSADVVVVGAGISGALLAQALTETGLRPLLIDRRRAALLGSTAASTALLQFELDTPLAKLSRIIGPRNAGRAWIASRDAVNDLCTKARKLGIGAHLATRPSLYLAGNTLDPRGLRREVRLRQKIGLPSEYLERRALRDHFGIHRGAALLSHGNAEANPVELAAGYLRVALRAGARFHAPHELLDLERVGRKWLLSLSDGIEIRADRVAFCTGYEIPKIVPGKDNRIVSTWALATRAQPRALWPQRALIWESSEPYLYLRATADGRVICGGEDEDFSDAGTRDALIPAKTARLESKLHRLFPHLDARAALSWTGSFGSSPDGMPTIGQIPGFAGCYAVLGFGGNGITFSMLAAKLITAAIAGKRTPEARLFEF
jgi:glycine/D-amino acid oxidase-like deaminating enzyme